MVLMNSFIELNPKVKALRFRKMFIKFSFSIFPILFFLFRLYSFFFIPSPLIPFIFFLISNNVV